MSGDTAGGTIARTMSHRCRLLLIQLLLAAIGPFIAPLASAAPFPDSVVQVGAWRLGAYTYGQGTTFSSCAISRTQNDGFRLNMGHTPGGVRGMSAEAPNWELKPNQVYTASITVGSSSFTFTGNAIDSRLMTFRVSPEIFSEMKSGTYLSITANQRHFSISLDGVETAVARMKDCVKEYTGRTLKPEQGPSSQAAPVAAPPKPAEQSKMSSGTGFYIDGNTLITNFHVVNGCTSIRVTKGGVTLGGLRVVAHSAADDLIVLRGEHQSKAFLKLRAGAPIKPTEPVLVFGYPLTGALSSAGNTTLGNVTALVGLRDDARFIQISAAVQPGNSGGPAVDEAGRLMGIVVSKLNAMAVARVTGDIPQNVNFAIKASTLARFLDANGIAYQADSSSGALSNIERAERAEAASVQLVCRR